LLGVGVDVGGAEFDWVRLFISVDEVRRIQSLMHLSLGLDEAHAEGHFLLECEGRRRRWVTTNGSQLTVFEDEGPEVEGLPEPQACVEILVNSRFFRNLMPSDLLFEVRLVDGRRLQTVSGDGYEMTLPEHPGPFPDWRGRLDSVSGVEVVVDSRLLFQALGTAGVVPFGVGDEGEALAMLYGRDGKLVVQTEWESLPDSVMVLAAEGAVPDTEPVSVWPNRLVTLLRAVDLPLTYLTLPSTPDGWVGVQAGRYCAALKPVDLWQNQRQLLERLLCEFLGVKSMKPDGDGDYLIEVSDDIQLFARLVPDIRPVSVQVFSVLASNVVESPGLLSELNSLNADTPYVKMIYAAGAVMAEVDVVAETMGMAELSNALRVVRGTSENYQGILSSFFGSTPQDGPR